MAVSLSHGPGKGIEAYQAMVTAKQYKERWKAVICQWSMNTRSVAMRRCLRVEIVTVDNMAGDVALYEFAALDGQPLPEWTAGAHLDIVVAPEFLRQYSMSGDPADRSKYQIGVLREDQGRGGSALLHRIFTKGRKIFISKPINHFPLEHSASKSFLMGGGIGITPMIAMAHEAHAAGLDFEMHYSVSSRATAGYLAQLEDVAWSDRMHLHVSDENTRADLDTVLQAAKDGAHVYTCGPDNYMQAVMDAAERCGGA